MSKETVSVECRSAKTVATVPFCADCGFDRVDIASRRCRVCGFDFARAAVLDSITSALTAFDTWREFTAAMGEPGRQVYCPTIHDRGRRYRRLIALVRASGYKVFSEGRVA